MKSFEQLKADAGKAPESAPLFTWGLSVYDGVLAAPGTLVTVAGWTGGGKSMFSLLTMGCIDAPCLYVSLEDGEGVVAKRIGMFPPSRLPATYFTVPTRPRLEYVVADIRESYDALLLPKLVVVDYIQLLKTGKDKARHEDVGDVLAELKGLGRELGFVTLLVSQLKRPSMDGEGGKPRRPTRWDMRDSSDIENSSEAILLLHPQTDSTVEVFLEKSKSSPTGASMLFERGRGGWLAPVGANKAAEAVNPF